MSRFSPEYLAEVEHGASILADCHRALNEAEKLLEDGVATDNASDVLDALGLAAAAVQSCVSDDAIMPHDLDEVSNRLLAVTVRAAQRHG